MVRILPSVARATNILILDIERLPGLAEVWDQKTGFVPHHRFQRLPATICFAAKRYGQPGAEFWSDWDQGHEEMVRRSWELYDQADIVVTYNGISFDNKHLRTDWDVAGLGEPRPWKDVDLFRVNKNLGLVSYSMQHAARVLGIGGKDGHYDPEVAHRAMAGSELDQRKLRRYNIGDIRLTERMYDRRRGMMPQHPAMRGAGRGLTCNQCGSSALEENGVYQAQVLLYPQYRCRRCTGNIADRRSCGRLGHSKGVA
jgi:hypothetical protein